MFGDEILNDALSILNFAPLLYMLFGYWVIGNRQIFSNLTFPILKFNSTRLSGHIIPWNLTKVPIDQSFPFLVFGLILLVLLPLRVLTKKIFDFFTLEEVNIQIDEDLATYYWAVEKEDRKEIIAEEINIRNLYNIKMMPDEALKAYEEAQDVDNPI